MSQPDWEAVTGVRCAVNRNTRVLLPPRKAEVTTLTLSSALLHVYTPIILGTHTHVALRAERINSM